MQPLGVMFHHFHGPEPPYGQGSITADDLRALLNYLGPARILAADEWLHRVEQDKLQPGDLCLTFDDNLRCQYDVALPVLEEFGLTAFWFISTAVLQGRLERLEIYRAFRMRHFPSVDEYYAAFFATVASTASRDEVEEALRDFDPATYLVQYPFYSDSDRRYRYVRDVILGPVRYGAVLERMLEEYHANARAIARGLWLDDGCIRALHDAGHMIGLHSHTHPTALAQLDEEEQRQEYADNHAYLRSLLGVTPRAMSHPCNSYSDTTLAILRELGIVCGFRSNSSPTPFGALEMPREDHINLIQELRQCESQSSRATSPVTSR
jgi:peptidoglycan/xylan/chitin deacetylase (PgdA/CDA1 family)